MTEFEQWWWELLDRYGTRVRIAEAAGISLGALTRQIEMGSLGFKPLLRIALDSGDNPSVVLRRAGKYEEADLIEQLYGPARDRRPAVDRLMAAAELVSDELLDHLTAVALAAAQHRRENSSQ